MASGITGTGNLAAAPTAYSGTNTQLTQAIQDFLRPDNLNRLSQLCVCT